MPTNSYTSASSLADHTGARPDRNLVVRCDYYGTNKKLTYPSARNCTPDLLRQHVEKAFALASRSFSVRWTDDEGEETYIQTDEELTEAIQYYCKGEEPTGSSTSSNFSYRSFARSNRIVMQVQIIVEYDGPALSDTASLSSLEDDRGSQRSMSLDVPHIDDQDDDAITVSSKDTGSQECRQKPDSLFKKLLSRPSRSALRLPARKGRSRSKNSEGGLSDFQSSYRQSIEGSAAVLTEASGHIDTMPSTSSGNGSRRYPSDPSAVFERLKLEEQPEHSISPQHSIQWLQEHHRLQQTRLGVAPPPSDADTFSINTDQTATTDDFEGRLSMDGPPLVKVRRGGKTYYDYNVGFSDGLRETASTEYDASASDNAHVRRERPLSMTTATEDSAGILSSGYPVSSESSSQRMSLSQSSISQPIQYNDLLVPDEVTACSECNDILDSMRYVCTTCGEKTPLPRAELLAMLESGKGKGKATKSMYSHSSGSGSTIAYPPHAHRSNASSTTAFSGIDTEAFRSMGSATYQKPLPDLPPATPTVVVGASVNHHHLQQRSNSSSSSSSSSSATRTSGYELCALCLQRSGVFHGIFPDEENVSSIGMVGDSPPSPQELSARLRRAPDQKGQLRHAYSEKMWGFNGWVDVVHEESQTQKCTVCKSTPHGKRYKCASCDTYTVCRACYSDIHNIHPIHAFLVMPDKPMRTQSAPGLLYPSVTFDAADEPSMTHSGVKCYHCMLDIVGARFRCIDCASVDICSNCESAGLPGNLHSSEGGHDSSHVMLKIPRPINTSEVESLSRYARGLQNGYITAEGHMRASPGSGSSSFAKTVIDGDADSEDHLMLCHSCGGSIIGVRYQCLSCPSKPTSYSLCASCEEKSYQVHDPMHIFVKLDRPVDNHAPLQSPVPIVPPIYSSPAGPLSPAAPENPQDYLTELLHPRAFCDRHMGPIVGKWLRCLYCAEGKDLCSDCEALDTHDNTHAFVVFKAPVDMASFARLVGLDTGIEESLPILREPVYFS